MGLEAEAAGRGVPAALGQVPCAGFQRGARMEVQRSSNRSAQLSLQLGDDRHRPSERIAQSPGHQPDEARRPFAAQHQRSLVVGIADERTRLLDGGGRQLAAPDMHLLQLPGQLVCSLGIIFEQQTDRQLRFRDAAGGVDPRRHAEAEITRGRLLRVVRSSRQQRP